MKNILNRKRGFTLIELLVVIAIIGILAALIIVSLSGARNKATDTQLKNNARNLDTALAQYYQDNSSTYIAATTQQWNNSSSSSAPAGTNTGYSFIAGSTLATGLGAYLSSGSSSAVFVFSNVSAGYITAAGGTSYALATGLKNTSEAAVTTGNGVYATSGAGAVTAGNTLVLASIGTWTSSIAFTGAAANKAFVTYGPQ